MKTIIIINDASHITGGAGNVALSSAMELAKRGYNIILFTGKGPIAKEIISQTNIQVICLNQKDILNDKNRLRAMFQGIWNRQAKYKLCEVLSKLDISNTIVHIHSWTKTLSPSIFYATSKYNVRIFITIHDYFITCPNGGLFNYNKCEKCSIKPLSIKCLKTNCDSRSYLHKIWRFIRQKVQNYAMSRNNKITLICISDLNEKLIRTTLKNNYQIYRLENPINLRKSIIPCTDKLNNRIKNQYLYVGRLSKEKGVNLFCRAIEELDLRGVVVGDGNDLNHYKKKFKNINFVGWKSEDELSYFYENSKCLIFPSICHEGSPLTTKEAQSYGLPCIVSDGCAAKDDVIDGITGFIFKSGNIDALKSAIIEFENSDERLFISETINHFDKDKYTMDNHIRSLIMIYNS